MSVPLIVSVIFSGSKKVTKIVFFFCFRIGACQTSKAGRKQGNDVLMAKHEGLPEYYMGVSKNRGTPKWMVYNGKPY